MQIIYEWDWEVINDDSGDIEDHWHFDTLAIGEKPPENQKGYHSELVLVRDEWKNVAGENQLDNRQWAYVENGELPNEFDGGAKVPVKYINQYRKYKAGK